MDVPVFPLVFNSLGPINVTLTVKDPGGLTDTITQQVYPYTKVSITAFDVKDTLEKTKAKAMVNCTHPITITLQLYKTPSEGSQELVAEQDYECNSGYKEIGPELESSQYLLKATIKDASLNCSKCSDQKYFTVSQKIETNAPEIHPVLLILIALTVLALAQEEKRSKK
jgi:hypothetical protein